MHFIAEDGWSFGLLGKQQQYSTLFVKLLTNLPILFETDPFFI